MGFKANEMTATIGKYLIELRRKLILSQKPGFDPNPSQVPPTLYVKKLREIREEGFLNFRRKLIDDRVLVIKVLTSPTIPLLQEAVLFCDLKGNGALINLTEVSSMSPEKRKSDTYLLDIKALLADENSLRVVENIEDVIKLGERIHVPLKDEPFVDLRGWHPKLPAEYCPSIKYVHPRRVNALKAPFRISEERWGWTWNLLTSEGELGAEQQRLLYALSSSLIAMALDGIVERIFATDAESRPPEHLAFMMKGILTDELLQSGDDDKEKMDTSEAPDKSMAKRIRFPAIKGAEAAESLAFGRIKAIKKMRLKDTTSPIMHPMRSHFFDLVAWEEALPVMDVVKDLEQTDEEVPALPPASKSCLKPFDKNENPVTTSTE